MVNEWYGRNKNSCPNCGADLTKLCPLANLFPHYIGECDKQTIYPVGDTQITYPVKNDTQPLWEPIVLLTAVGLATLFAIWLGNRILNLIMGG